MNSTQDDVRAAREGDHEAFTRLVMAHRFLAEGYARLWLRDAEAARDAVQDAFLDAWLRLRQLRDPAAFPGWLRRIVLKHCDRRTRVGPRPAGEDELSALPTSGLTLDAAPPSTEAALARSELHAAVEALPAHERVVVALHYFGEIPQREVADFLEVSLETVKKRLERARRRLGRVPEPDPERDRGDPGLADRIRFFLALRARDLDLVDVLLDQDPSRLEAPERWTDGEALGGGFPLAHGHTPLVLAAQRGDLGLARRLLARGADPNGPCACAGGDTPLLAATLHGRLRVAEALLEAGADPSRASAGGFTPLLVALHRGQDELAALLRSHGGEAPAVGGLDAEGWRLEGERFRARLRARGTKAGLEARGRLIPTGIRALDGWAPIETGMLVAVRGAAETGLMVLMGELGLRLQALGLPVTWWSTVPRPWFRAELETLAAGSGLDAEVVVGPPLAELRGRGRALFVFAQEGGMAEVEAHLLRLRDEASLVVVVEPWIPVTAGRAPTLSPTLSAPWDARWVTDAARAERGIYPAFSRASMSRSPGWGVRDRVDAGSEEALDRDCAQWFHGWAPHTGRPGEDCPPGT